MKALALSFLLLGTVQASACAVCFQGNHARKAYLATTGALIGLPVVIIGGFVIAIRRRMK
ncbi:MAG: hypothetical protein K1X78_08315 [Verrucomicrobiaceae bacterium]|nr:hypothetical protein [Verrucomicrobiaceae bacterium]